MAQDPRSLIAKAEKAAAGATGGFSLFGGRQVVLKKITCHGANETPRTEKWEQAAEAYNRARIQLFS
jgi:alpha-soluble NSF attachment protein